MQSDNQFNHRFGSCRSCICCTPYCQSVTVPSLCNGCHASFYASSPMKQWYNNVLPNYQLTPPKPILGFSNFNNPINLYFQVEDDSWLLPNPDNQYQGQFNKMQPQINYDRNYGILPVQSSIEEQEQILKFNQGIHHDFSRGVFNNTPATFVNESLPPMGVSYGNYSSTIVFSHESGLKQFDLPLYHTGNLMDETARSHSNSTSISSEEIKSKKSSKFPPMSRQERVLRYFEKKKARKYKKKVEYSSRRTYAQTRPRIRGRFARSSHTETKTIFE